MEQSHHESRLEHFAAQSCLRTGRPAEPSKVSAIIEAATRRLSSQRGFGDAWLSRREPSPAA